jgi:hypothetical protein
MPSTNTRNSSSNRYVGVSGCYPFGMQMQGREFAGGMGYRYGFGTQETDNEVSGSGNSYTAEFWQYDCRLGRRWNVDPVYKYNICNYSAYSCNPIRRVDPKGANDDDYGLDKNGNIKILRETSDKSDRLISINEDGTESSKTIEVEKGILNKVSAGRSKNGNYHYMKLNGDDKSNMLFEFVAKNSLVEWSQVKYNSNSNYVSTSHNLSTELGGVHLLYQLHLQKVKIRAHIHSHPTTTNGPSGFGAGSTAFGDKNFAEWIKKYNPTIRLWVFEVISNSYIEYNHNGVVR